VIMGPREGIGIVRIAEPLVLLQDTARGPTATSDSTPIDRGVLLEGLRIRRRGGGSASFDRRI